MWADCAQPESGEWKLGRTEITGEWADCAQPESGVCPVSVSCLSPRPPRSQEPPLVLTGCGE